MTSKHPHYDTIVAWAEGKTIQCWCDGGQTWYDWDYNYAPAFDCDGRYRIKPVTIRYRNYLCKICHSNVEFFYVTSVSEAANKKDPREECPQFVRWLGDWQEVEI